MSVLGRTGVSISQSGDEVFYASDAVPLSREEQDEVALARADLVRVGRKMAGGRLVVGSAGNLSVRVGNLVVITPSGIDYDQIREESMCVVDPTGLQLAGDGRPSSEYQMHRRIYDTTPAGAVVHTHSMAAVAASTLCDELPAIHYAILRLGGPTVRVARYETFGSDALSESAGVALRDRYAALLQNHGAVAVGATLREAYGRAELVEWLAEVWVRACQVGQPRILDQAELAAVAEQSRRRRYEGVAG
jgi:L-fuculose-phosphate aldolase